MIGPVIREYKALRLGQGQPFHQDGVGGVGAGPPAGGDQVAQAVEMAVGYGRLVSTHRVFTSTFRVKPGAAESGR